jgi:repressor LexA
MGKHRTEQITPLQRQTLDFIADYIDREGYPPTVTEMSVGLGVAHTSVHDRVNQLVAKGYLKRDNNKARGLKLTNRPDRMAGELVAVPIIGVVAAGQPVLAEENQIGEVLVEGSIIRSGQHFALRASGKSMVEAGIEDGDLLIVRRQALAEDGDIVVALLNNLATVKRLKIRSETVALIPENSNMKPIPVSPDDDLKILGKVVGWKRRGS